MPKGIPDASSERCGRILKTGRRCAQPASPMTWYAGPGTGLCWKHGAFSIGVQAKAREYADRYECGLVEPTDPPWRRNLLLRRFERAQQRINRRQLKKAGVDLAEYDRQQAAIAQQHEAEQDRLRAANPEEFERRRAADRARRDWMMSGMRPEDRPPELDDELEAPPAATDGPVPAPDATDGPTSAPGPAAGTGSISGTGQGPYQRHRPAVEPRRVELRTSGRKPPSIFDPVPDEGDQLPGGGRIEPDGGRPARAADRDVIDESELDAGTWHPNRSYEDWVRGQRERPGDGPTNPWTWWMY